MKRFIAGTSLALGVAAGLANTSPANADNHMCAEAYDDTAENQISDELSRAIGNLAASGTEAHVQILENGEANGILATSDTEKFVDELAEECGWNDKKRVNIIITQNPKAYDIFTVGALQKSVDSGEKSRIEESLIEDLQDRSSSFQSDAVQALEGIDKADKTAPAVKPPSKPIDIPFKGIGLTLGGLVAMSGGGLRIKRGHDLKVMYRDTVSDASGQIFVTVAEAESLLSVLQTDDAKELRTLVGAGKDEIVSLEASRDQLNRTYRQQRFKVWPSVEDLQDEAEEFDSRANSTVGVQTEIAAELQQVQSFLTAIETMDRQVEEKFDQLDTLLSGLQSTGWNLEGIESVVADLKSKRQVISELRAQSYIEKPAELVAEITPTVDSTILWLQELPNERAKVDRELDKQPAEIERLTEAAQRTVQTLNLLRTGYDGSCLAGVESNGEEANQKIALLKQLQQSSLKLKGKQDYASLQQGMGLNASFATVVSEISGLTSAVNERVSLLEKLQSTLPERVQSAQQNHASAIEYATQLYPDDVEPDTKKSLALLSKKLDAVKSKLGKSKPAYLEIDDSLNQVSQEIDSQMRTAQAQRTEMEQLRSSSLQLEREAKAKLSSLKSYVTSNRSDVTGVSSSGFDINPANTGLGRSELRQQVEHYKSIERAISQQRSKAERQVRQAEEDRRRKRQQEEDEERRRRAAAASASYSSGGYSSGGGGHSSGGFGGGHSSGSFGGDHGSGSW